MGKPPLPEGAELRLKGGPALLMILHDLSPEEIWGIRRGRALFGVREVEGVLFFLYTFPDAGLGWSDAPYHRALEERASGPLDLPELGPEGRLLLQVVLVRGEDARLMGLRVLTLGPRVSRALLDGVARQGKEVPPDWSRRILSVYRQMGSEELARGAIVEAGGA
ncbi:MAG: hypothetical protein ABDH20_13170 [Thermus sp.]